MVPAFRSGCQQRGIRGECSQERSLSGRNAQGLSARGSTNSSVPKRGPPHARHSRSAHEKTRFGWRRAEAGSSLILDDEFDPKIEVLLSRSETTITDSVDLVTQTDHILRILRKEVIQPQVPLRLPCYDLVPIVELTFGACLPEG